MKFKKIPDFYFFTILDRLTRFEPAFVRYERVFDDIVSKFLLDISLKKHLSLSEKISVVEEILADSLGYSDVEDDVIECLLQLENSYFINNEISNKYLSSKINYRKIFEKIDNTKILPYNLSFFKYFLDSSNLIDLKKKRKEYSLLFPVEKVLLCEGQTEFLLLKTLFNLFDFDLDKNGILVIQAGGKNQVAKKYYKMQEYCKLPFFVLLDKDGVEVETLITTKLRKSDELYIISCGEFEDLIPQNVVMKIINFIHNNEISCKYDDFTSPSMVLNIEEIYRKYGFGEFKKANFALDAKKYIENFIKADEFKNSEITNILATLQRL